MPHQCVRCNAIYDDDAEEILKGCSRCGGKLFFYIRKDQLEEAKKATNKLTKKEKKEIEHDVYDIIGVELDSSKPVILDLEAIRIPKPGKYEIDLVKVFKKHPLVYKIDEGKYVIDLPESFRKITEKSKKA